MSIERARSFPALGWGETLALALAVLILLFAIGLAIVIAFSPSTLLPVGVVPTHGVSNGVGYSGVGFAVYVESGDISPGDMVVWRTENGVGWVMHPVVAEEPGGFVTKGAAMERTDVELGRGYMNRGEYAGTAILVVTENGVSTP